VLHGRGDRINDRLPSHRLHAACCGHLGRAAMSGVLVIFILAVFCILGVGAWIAGKK